MPHSWGQKTDIDRFHLVADVIDRVPKLGSLVTDTKQAIRERLIDHKQDIDKYGQDMPEIREWKWPGDNKSGSKITC
jgi:xylulose-5-phosphate/fructose-6-phosphate phosphoketolase